MRGAGSERHTEGQAKARIPMACDARGDSAAATRFGWIPSSGTDSRSATDGSRGTARQAAAKMQEVKRTNYLLVCTESGALMKPGRAVEMTGVWKARKTKPRFLSLPAARGLLRDFHIPTTPTTRRFLKKSTQERKPDGGSLRSRLRAHSSMRKCCSPHRPRLFVYGTLRRGFDNRYARLLERSARYLGLARVQGRLYDLGRYPGIQLQAEIDEWVTGDLFHLRTPSATFADLDEYEGPEFERLGATAILPNGDHTRCWVYEYRLPAPLDRRVLSGDFLKR